MRIQVVSDLHLEFEPTFRPVNVGSDVLVLSGDICMVSAFGRSEASPYTQLAVQFLDFFRHCSEQFPHVIYVLGNHEYYRGFIDEALLDLREQLHEFSNIHILQNTSVDIDDVRFVGSTLWTDINKRSPIADGFLRGAMNDFRIIQWKGKGYRRFSPMDAADLHDLAIQAIDNLTANANRRVVVCTHHAPSFMSVHPKYHNQDQMNAGYYSSLDQFIIDRPQIKIWTHGHMHDCFDYQVGGTRVVCNPRGYRDENKYFNPNNVWEV